MLTAIQKWVAVVLVSIGSWPIRSEMNDTAL
jgi:hypothetical protein